MYNKPTIHTSHVKIIQNNLSVNKDLLDNQSFEFIRQYENYLLSNILLNLFINELRQAFDLYCPWIYWVIYSKRHIPKKFSEDFVIIEKEKPRYQIPGYAGFVKSIKSQNIYEKTFGKATYNISDQNYLKGQDLPSEQKFVSSYGESFINPMNMLQRTAADIVGIPNRKIQVKEVRKIYQPIPLSTNQKFWGVEKTIDEVDQFTETKNWPKKDIKSYKYENYNMKRSAEKFYGTPQQKNYVKLQEPIPGYTGFSERICAQNIFGETFHNSRVTSKIKKDRNLMSKTSTFNFELKRDPEIRH